jgi:spoIIIJ-associated protein
MAHRFCENGRLDRPALIAELRRFLDLVVRASRLDLRYRVMENDSAAGDAGVPEVQVVFEGRDSDLLLERNADLLLSIEYIAHRWLRLDPHFFDHVQLDCQDYRAVRAAELRLSARLAAERVRDTRQPFRFNPMSPRERRIVHLALRDFQGIRTESEGAGDRRQVVIHPA